MSLTAAWRRHWSRVALGAALAVGLGIPFYALLVVAGLYLTIMGVDLQWLPWIHLGAYFVVAVGLTLTEKYAVAKGVLIIGTLVGLFYAQSFYVAMVRQLAMRAMGPR